MSNNQQQQSSQKVSDKVWDLATKLLVPAVIAIAAWVSHTDSRVTRAEYNDIRHDEQIAGLKQLVVDDAQVNRKILDALENLGNRMTRIETKLDHKENK
jgi:hypothetical protein